MKISNDKLRKIIMQEIKISITQAVQAAVEEELGSAQTYVAASPTSYIASHVATMGQISEDEDEDEDETNEGVSLTKSWLKNLIQEEVDEWIYSDAEVIKEDEDFLQDVKSTGEWTDYTIEELRKKKATLMKKEKRTEAEQKEVRQIQFAINAKEGDYKKKKPAE
jgi:hypothetical protein